MDSPSKNIMASADKTFPIAKKDAEEMADILALIGRYEAEGRGGWQKWVMDRSPVTSARFYALMRKYLPRVAAAYGATHAVYMPSEYFASGNAAFGRGSAKRGKHNKPTVLLFDRKD